MKFTPTFGLPIWLNHMVKIMDNPETGTEERILAAAKEVFLRDGFDGARMQTIAETAGINKALLHYYFRSKQRLFERVLQTKLAVFLPRIREEIDTKQTLREKLEVFVDAYLRMLGSNPMLPLFVISSVHRNPEFAKGLPVRPFDTLLISIREAIDSGEMRKVDPEHFFFSILGMCIMPYLSRNLVSHMMQKSPEEFEAFLAQRKPEIMHFINAMFIS